MNKKSLFLVFFAAIFAFSSFSQAATGKNSESQRANLRQGADAYKNEDWVSAMFFLRKGVSTPTGANDENMFMLIKSEIYAGEYKQAQIDCENFLTKYTFSPYMEYVQYQNGRLLHLLARNEDAIISLSDFCHQNTESQLYPLALFWIAEAFYDEYNFESARGLYQRVVSDYTGSEKAPQAQYKLDLIERRAREEKLLYLLKVIGEENLSTREEYERQLRVYALEDEHGVRRSLIEAQSRIAELEEQLDSGDMVVAEEVPEVQENYVTPTFEPQEAAAKKEEEEDSSKFTGTAVTSEPVIIQTVNESSIRVKQGQDGFGTSAFKTTDPKEAARRAKDQKRKAKQLEYLLQEQTETEGGAK